MDYLERVQEIAKKQGYSIRQIEIGCKLSNGTISKWKNSTPSIKRLEIVAAFLGVSVAEITGDKDVGISADEIQLIKDFRRLNAYDRVTVLDLIARELARPAPARVLTLPRSLQAASAGVGVPLEDDAFEKITVADTPAARRAAFALPVTGDSMEPLYHDGDVVLVEATPDVEEGEIGVFYVDGRGYLKKRGADCLISLNDKYAPIPLSASSRCFGRVIGVLPVSDIFI